MDSSSAEPDQMDLSLIACGPATFQVVTPTRATNASWKSRDPAALLAPDTACALHH